MPAKSPPAPRAADADDVRERLVAASTQLMLDHGFEGFGLDAVAVAARVSKTTLYAMFPDRAALVAAAVRAFVEAILANPPEIQQRHRQPRPALRALTQWTQANYFSAVQFGLYRVSVEAALRHAKLAEQLFAARKAITVGDRIMESQMSDGALRRADPAEASRWLGVLSIDGARYLMGDEPPDATTRDLMSRRALGFILHGAAGIDATAELAPEAVPSGPEPRTELRMATSQFEDLLEAAADEFVTSGYQRANVEAIARQAGCGRMTLRRHFGDKSGLFEAAMIARAVRSATAPTIPTHAPDVSSLEKLAAQVRTIATAPARLALQRVVITEGTRLPATARAVRVILDGPLIESTAPWLAQLPGVAAPRATARAFLILASDGNAPLVGASPASREHRSRLARDVAALTLHGLAGPKLRRNAS